jgi:hypothetical protein
MTAYRAFCRTAWLSTIASAISKAGVRTRSQLVRVALEDYKDEL